tara:strand:- start:268 stop:603 length:336 start_codon:yes stop_codon:yes gene_type:complete
MNKAQHIKGAITIKEAGNTPKEDAVIVGSTAYDDQLLITNMVDNTTLDNNCNIGGVNNHCNIFSLNFMTHYDRFFCCFQDNNEDLNVFTSFKMLKLNGFNVLCFKWVAHFL